MGFVCCCRLLFDGCRPLLVVCCSLFVGSVLFVFVCFLLFDAWCASCVVRCLWFVVHSLCLMSVL